MKLYTFPKAPSPRRVHLFLAEKGMEVEKEFVDLRSGAHLEPEFTQVNPYCTVPVLELDDGTRLCECVAICRYFEELQPDPPLFGRGALERAVVAERDHWVEVNGYRAVAEAFRNESPRMKDHALPDPRPMAQIPELAERGRRRYRWFLEDLDGLLEGRKWLAGEAFSVADITAWVTVEFAGWAMDEPPSSDLDGVQRWRRNMAARPSLQAVD